MKANAHAAVLEPDRGQIATFVHALFKHAYPSTWISLRSFYDDDSDKSFEIRCFQADDLETVIDKACRQAKRAANARRKVVFCPPTATFNNKKTADQESIVDGVELGAEIDKNPQASWATLEKLLGPATVVVASGGEWTNPESGEVEPKLHAHWRLKKPARGHERNLLKEARELVIAIVGSDTSHGPISHPIRWPGSWHRKGEPKLCQIIAVDPEREIDLHAALAALKKAAPAKADKTGPINDSPWSKLNSAAIGNFAAWVPEIFPTARKYHGDGFRVKSKDLGRKLQEDISFTRDGIKDFGVHDMGDELEGSRSPIDIVMQWKLKVPVADIARREHTSEFKEAVDWLCKRLDFTITEPEPPLETVEPIDLWGKFEPLPLPRKLLPKPIENFAFTLSDTMGADPAGIAMAALAVCAAATPDRITLKMKKHSDEWHECARIWVGLVGVPSTKKTPIMSAVIKTLMRLDGDLLRGFLYECEQYKNLTPEERKKTKAPLQKRLRLEDTTIEAAADVLAGSPEGVLLHQDELSGWFGAMDKYAGHRGAAKDRSFWLQSYNGGPMTWNRIGRGAGYIPNLSISLLGGIQPDVIRKLAAESYDDGFLQRMLTILLRDAVMGKDEPRPAIADSYAKLIERLTELSPPRPMNRSGVPFGDITIPLVFDDEAQRLREDLERKHLELMQVQTVNKKLASHIGKYDGLFGRLCVLWHCIEHAFDKTLPPIVSFATAKRVSGFMHRFLFRHAVAFYAGVLGLADDHDRLTAVAGYILAHKLERVTTRDIARGDGTMRKLTERDTMQVFEQLEALGWIDRVSAIGRTVKPGTWHWRVNPVVHVRFADQAKQEIARRAATREFIKNSIPEHRKKVLHQQEDQ